MIEDKEEQEGQVEPPAGERGTEADRSSAGTIAGRVPSPVEINGATKQRGNDGPKTGSRGADADREQTEEEREH
jgi:hypothetical protein